VLDALATEPALSDLIVALAVRLAGATISAASAAARNAQKAPSMSPTRSR